ncbi:Fimbrial assembly family protein OS=Pirellula staleyi (strain ATCC 27377 / DSM 6068 / ICPB 4128) GN=Psta_3666 PE=4 SV=1 [Gemmataceae bacterium]|nr:Fimbrial assembly family protein OS=Pirellula staleyi (strain ATCC 27377 / DSM 6068 / ICPB 4128) GN=Psta_3666 PE=4 SV=1 [Gemmataceae bacterium]VTT99344.1 Fimbrial assembly family protein OS=Pirellula staleyi (strain ATCC 27377 / DSM 6068 / ICPB 4128) GN=Psta_3666 PE=4 SV=1 [Gemmataceae bacterium]
MSKFIAIDLDPQGLLAVGGTARGGHAKVEHAVAWAGTEAEGGPGPLTPESARRIGEQLRDRLKEAGVVPAPVMVSVPRDRVILKELRYPAVPLPEEPNVVRFQAMKELSDAPEDVVLDYVPLAGEAAGGERRSMAVAVRKDLFRSVQLMCEAANMRLASVTPRPYAVAAGLGRALATGAAPEGELKAGTVAVLAVGPGGGEFTVSRGGEVAFTRSVAGPVVASDSLLLSEVRRNLTMYAGANPGRPVQAVYVAGAGGETAGRLGAALGLAVHEYDPLAGEVPAVPDTQRGRFAGAAGLLAARAADAIPINFAEPRQPKADADPVRRQLVLVGLVAAAVLVGGALLGFLALSAADDDIALKTKQRNDAKQQCDALELDAKRLKAAEDWRARQVVWLDELYDMADRFPVAGGFHASSFIGKAIPPDPKTGKQEHQAAVEVRVSARSPEPVNALLYKIEADSVGPPPKNPKDPKGPPRFYVGADKTIGGPSQGEAGARDYTVFARVNNRPAALFNRTAAFTPPSRKGYPPTAAAKEVKEREAAEAKEDKDAPAPRAKEKDGAE